MIKTIENYCIGNLRHLCIVQFSTNLYPFFSFSFFINTNLNPNFSQHSWASRILLTKNAQVFTVTLALMVGNLVFSIKKICQLFSIFLHFQVIYLTLKSTKFTSIDFGYFVFSKTLK
jgi:hypothetical protein